MNNYINNTLCRMTDRQTDILNIYSYSPCQWCMLPAQLHRVASIGVTYGHSGIGTYTLYMYYK